MQFQAKRPKSFKSLHILDLLRRAEGSSFTTDYLNHRFHRLNGFCFACSKFHNGKNGNFSEKRKLLRIIG